MILMAVRLIMAPPATGKTRLCLHLAQSRSGVLDNPAPDLIGLRQVWALMPDQPQVGYFRRRLGQIGGALGVRISTFETLYTEILERAGMPVLVTDERVQYRLILATVENLFSAGHLDYYGPIHRMPGFINAHGHAHREIC